MNAQYEVAAAHLRRVRADLEQSGVSVLVEQLVRRVWRTDVDRFEPALGDTPMSLGVQASVNLRELADRHSRRDPDWAVPGLTVATPHSSLEVRLQGAQIRFMKAPPSERRLPNWSNFRWDSSSGPGRYELARTNSLATGGRSDGADQLPLFPLTAPRGPLLFLLIWSGEIDTGLTAGWLTLPVLGDSPFLAIAPIWWEEATSRTSRSPLTTSPTGDSFDVRPVPEPGIKIKRAPDQAQS